MSTSRNRADSMSVGLANDRRSLMTLLSGPLDAYSHCCRVVLMEKDIECTVTFVSVDDDPAIVGEHNPYGETPTLVDREVSLYGMDVIMAYLDERFPHPPLMPPDPVTRAKTRLIIARLTRDWLVPIYRLGETMSPEVPETLKHSLEDGLMALSPIVAHQPFFLGDEYTLVDAYFSVLLWRLPMLGVELPGSAAPLVRYGKTLFERPSFFASMSEPELALREL